MGIEPLGEEQIPTRAPRVRDDTLEAILPRSDQPRKR